MSLALTLSVLAIPLLLGIGCGVLRLFPQPDAAIGALNTYVLYLAFPVLIVVGMTDKAFSLPRDPAFYLVVPTVALLLVGTLALLRGRWPVRGKAGAVALTSLFANTAYVGLPVVEGVLGRSALGLGALAVAIHVTTAMLIGPTLLLTWGDRDAKGALGAALGKVARQPLAWAPVVGLLLRFAPAPALETLATLLGPIGRTASPVGLFLIGLFIHTHGRQLPIGTDLILHLLAKLAVVPALTWALTTVAVAAGLLAPQGAAVLVLLSAMPTAISTFSIAKEFDSAVPEVTVAIVASTALAAVVIPLVASMV